MQFKNNRLLISFSGGETSAYMAYKLLEQYRYTDTEIVVVFANTGQEHEETLRFVDACDKAFDLNCVWIEALPQYVRGSGALAKVVDFESASRNGEPFEAVIKKYGIPNRANPVCSRELKLVPIHAYMRSIGRKKNTYTSAVGIRADEIDRMADDMDARNLYYPLVEWDIAKANVNRFWESQPFRLPIKSWEGNCKTCWKKSNRKLYAIARQNPEWFDFFAEMEFRYSSFTPEGRVNSGKPPHFFFSRGRDVTQVLETAYLGEFLLPDDERLLGLSPDIELDALSTCTESCEAFQ